ncbi:MAG: MG2 domain-containing protein [Bacteroidales bacterium]|nr:MG2 domain-containing protein [Bacteroidales bacterium]
MSISRLSTIALMLIMSLLPLSLSASKKTTAPDFDFPQDVSKKAQADLSAALRANNGQQMIDALVRYGIAEANISDENLPAIVKKIDEVLAKEKRADFKALLLYLKAQVFQSYAESHFNVRETPEGERPADYTEWGRDDFNDEIKTLMAAATADKDALRSCPITAYSSIFTFDDLGALYMPTLYDVLLNAKDEMGNATHEERAEQTEYLLKAGHTPAYLCRKGMTADADEKLSLYEQYKTSEHSGLLLTNLPTDATAYKAYKDYLQRFPSGLYAYAVGTKVSDIEAKNVNISFNGTHNSLDSLKVTCSVKNVNRYTVKIFKITDAYLNALKKAKTTTIDTKKCQLVASCDEQIDRAIPFFYDEKRITRFSPLPHGQYLVVAEFSNGTKTITSEANTGKLLAIYDITSFNVACENSEVKIFAVDRTTGAPLKGVNVKGKSAKGVTADDGSFSLPSEIIDDEILLTKGTDVYSPKVKLHQFYEGGGDDIHKTMKFYTDLGIYRPGETIKFAGVLYRVGVNSRTVASGENVVIRLMDANYKEVKSLSLNSDAFGRIEGEFEIPTDRMNGRWTLRCSGKGYYGSHNVNVSEYKTPTFSIDFPDAKHNFVSKQPVKISGVATTYSGMPIANAEVRLLLSQQQWSWFWRLRDSNGTTLCDTTAMTDAEGRFSIEYPAEIFGDTESKFSWNWHSFTLNAKLTTAAGESREAYHSFVVGRRRSIEITDFNHENSKMAKLPVVFNSTEEADKSLLCTYTLKDDKKNVVKASSFRTDKPEADFSDVPSGQYTITVQLADEPDIKADATVVIYRKTDRTAPIADVAMWIPAESYRVDEKNVAHATIGVSAPESHIYYVATSRAGIVKQGWMHYKQGLHDFAMAIPSAPDEYLDITFYNVYRDKNTRCEHHFASAINKQTLDVKLTSFRDKLVPGEKEKWTMKFVDKNGQGVQGAMMLEMYDKALESLSSNAWSLYADYLGKYRFTLYTQGYGSGRYSNASFRAKVKGRSANADLPEFNLYDMDFFLGGIPLCDYAVEARPMMKAQAVEMKGLAVEESAMADNAVMLRGAASKQNASLDKEEEEATAKQLENITLREADVKTALWMPMLTTDTSGDMVVEFEAPQFNTTWVMQAIGFTSNMLTKRITKEVLTQKPIMVKSALPRFVRSGDVATLKANVMNATDEASAFTAIIEIFNPRTQQVMATKNFSGNLEAKGTEVVSLEFSVPDTIPFVGFRVKAANARFGDGEQVMFPVLSDVAPVIETEPFFVDAAKPHFSLTMPQFPRESRVTLEYCDNPVWYCVTALPTIYEPNYRIATSLAHNLFAEVLAQGVAKSNPLIKPAIKQWMADGQDSTLVSMLQKNGDLKIGDLLASPWINEADRQSLRMSKLIELFDEQKMAAEHKKIVDALKTLQRADGGFPWYEYPGCESSVWTTETVLEIIGELQHLGYLKDDADIAAITKKAVAYYDKKMLEMWNEQLKYDKKNYSGFSSYVYNRSLFPAIALPKANAAMMKKALSAMTKDWKGMPLGEKAYYAMALHRNGQKQVAQRIVESLRQFAITKPELGMYWDNLQQGWRYFDKVAVTATILEAMHEVGAQQDEIDQVRKWMLLMKQSNDWGSSSLAADAVYALLSTGSQWLERSAKPSITINGEEVQFSHIDQYVGYCRKTIPATSGATLTIDRSGASPAWGAVYCQYKAPMTSVAAKDITEMSIRKEYQVYGPDGKLIPATDATFKVGDKVQVRLVIKVNKDLDFVTVADERGACFEPKDQTSGYRYMDRSYFFQETKDATTNLFFTSLNKGTHIVSYDVYVTAEGTYSAGIATAQCQYAPQLTAHSAGTTVTVTAK